MFQSVEEVFNHLNPKKDRMILGLERMEWMLQRLNHPERRLKFIHIAGTNGKGSTAAMIASVLQEAGYDTGLFTSPYLEKWNEQIRLNGQPISDQSFLHWFNYLWSYVKEMEELGLEPPSYYELWTLVTICYFAYEACPWFVVWETLLGGRLDATNAIHPVVSVITQIGMDHQDLLGETITKITKEKAAIIKPGVPVVSSAKNNEARSVIIDEAERKKSSLYLIDRDFQVQLQSQSSIEQEFDFSNVYREVPKLKTQLIGQHQLENASAALMTLEVLRQHYATLIEDNHLRQGLYQAAWPGRLEKISRDPLILLDGAHNIDGIKALAKTVENLYTYKRFILLTAMMRDKEVDQMLQYLLPLADQVIVTQVTDQSRSLSANELTDRIKQLQPQMTTHTFSSEIEGMNYAKKNLQSGDLLLVTGSLYLISTIRSLLS